MLLEVTIKTSLSCLPDALKLSQDAMKVAKQQHKSNEMFVVVKVCYHLW